MQEFAKLIPSLLRVQHALKQADIQSAAVGAIAVGVWAEPRQTKDVDLRVLLQRDEAQRLVDALPPDCVPIHGPPKAWLERNAMLFVCDSNGVRIDLLLADIGFDEEVIHRAVTVEILPDTFAEVCTAEDLIIYKMISTREKDAIDVINVIRRQGSQLDHEYINQWLRQFEIALDDSTLVSTFQRYFEKYR